MLYVFFVSAHEARLGFGFHLGFELAKHEKFVLELRVGVLNDGGLRSEGFSAEHLDARVQVGFLVIITISAQGAGSLDRREIALTLIFIELGMLRECCALRRLLIVATTNGF